MTRSHDPELAFDETAPERWKRRLVTGPGLLAITPIYLALLPGLLAATAATDVVRRRPLTTSRFAATLGLNLSMHSAAFAGLFFSWLAGGRWAGADPERERKIEQFLQVWWAKLTWQASSLLYSMDLSVDGAEQARPGPILLLPRHASLIDTLLPLVLVAGPHGMRLRYVMKRELLWDPVLDALGHRWPTAFVRRGTHDPRELEHVTHLLDDLGPRDAIVLFPEGTRYSQEKRDRILEHLRDEPVRLERARRLRHVLPPHAGGVRALLERNKEIDVVFMAHTGLEGASHLEDLMAGTLIGSRVRAKLWRVRRPNIPTEAAAQADWLNEQWERVDGWIDERRRANRHADRNQQAEKPWLAR